MHNQHNIAFLGTMKKVSREDIDRQTEEVRVFRSIMSELQKKRQSSTTLNSTFASEDYRNGDFKAEQKILLALSSFGVKEGIVASIAAFIILRRGPAMVGRFLNRRASGDGFRLEKSSSQQPFQWNKSTDQTGTFTMMDAMKSVAKLGIDVFLSLLVGSSISFVFTDVKVLSTSFSSIPLVEGRSVISDEFCSTVQQEIARHHQRNPKFWNDVVTRRDSSLLLALHQFSTNCYKRQSYERKLRDEQGLSDAEPVKIPAGGVPTDYVLTDLGVNLVQREIQGDGSEFDFETDTNDSLFFNDSMHQWEENFVKDREDDRK